MKARYMYSTWYLGIVLTGVETPSDVQIRFRCDSSDVTIGLGETPGTAETRVCKRGQERRVAIL